MFLAAVAAVGLLLASAVFVPGHAAPNVHARAMRPLNDDTSTADVAVFVALAAHPQILGLQYKLMNAFARDVASYNVYIDCPTSEKEACFQACSALVGAIPVRCIDVPESVHSRAPGVPPAERCREVVDHILIDIFNQDQVALLLDVDMLPWKRFELQRVLLGLPLAFTPQHRPVAPGGKFSFSGAVEYFDEHFMLVDPPQLLSMAPRFAFGRGDCFDQLCDVGAATAPWLRNNSHVPIVRVPQYRDPPTSAMSRLVFGDMADFVQRDAAFCADSDAAQGTPCVEFIGKDFEFMHLMRVSGWDGASDHLWTQRLDRIERFLEGRTGR